MLSCQRHLFSLPQDLHYLNCGYMSPLPINVEEAGIAGIRRKRVPSDIESRDFLAGIEAIREKFASLVGLSGPERIAVIPSVSYGLATAARNLPVAASQNIVILARQFPSNVYVWRRLAASSGAELRTATPPSEGAQRARRWNERLLDIIDSHTAIVALGQVHWTDGTLFDVAAIAARCREVGAALVLDGTQSVGALPFDVELIRPDALVCAGYKWLMGPYSIGVAYFGPRFDGGTPLEETWLARVGSDDFPRLIQYQDAHRPGAARYEPGEVSNFTLVPMLAAALDLIAGWGVAEIQAYCCWLTESLAAEVRALGFEAEDSEWRAGHLVGLRMPGGIDPWPIQAELTARRIAVSLRGDVLRVSPHVYNDRADIGALTEALRDVMRSAVMP
ncbi:MAG: aminotransferase class V-fold PLP-dependent enzyme [Gemmatimonadota bacterium]|nr:MAG: aminotransferase class V-fold PLP-dependent enzyme [Gemmatimonadota bacterium]